MKKLFFIIGLFFSLSAMAQPTNYTKINMRYRWLSGMFDSALYVPRYNGTPSGVRINETSAIDGMIAMDTTNNRLYIYSGGSWIRLAAYSEVAAYTAGNGLTLSGSQFKLGGTLTENTYINGKQYLIDIDSLNILSIKGGYGGDGNSIKTINITNSDDGGMDGIFMSTLAKDGIKEAEINILAGGNYIYADDYNKILSYGKTEIYSDTISLIGNTRLNGGWVSIGTNIANSSSILDVTSTTRGAVLPRMNTTQMNAISSPVAGLMVYNSDSVSYCYYNGSAWVRLANYSEITAYTAGNGLTLSGSQFKLGGTLTENTTITTTGYNFNLPGIPTVSSTTGRKVALIDTATGKVERIDPASLVSTPTLQQVLTAGSTLTTNNIIDGGGFDFQLSQLNLLSLNGTETTLSGSTEAISLRGDSIQLLLTSGKLNIDSLRSFSSVVDTLYKKPMTWDTRNGRWEYAESWYGGGGTVSSASGTGVSLVNGSSLIKRLKEGTGITITDNTDSVTISRVSDSTMVRNLRWKYRNTFEQMDEFLGNGISPGWISQSSGAGSSAGTSDFAWADVDTTWQGATYASTGTTTTGRGLALYGNATSSNTGSFRGYNTSFAVYETRVRFDTLSNTTNEYTALFGWMDWFGSSFYQKGIKFVYDRATYGDYWVLRSDDGGTSAVVTTSSIAAKTDYVLRIEVYNWQMGSSGGSIKAYINDVEVVASSGTYPIVSNIAKTDAFYPCYWIQKSAGTVARKVFLDWVYQYAEFIKRL